MRFLGVIAFLVVAVCYAKAGEIQMEVVLEAMAACKDAEGASDDDFEDMKHHRPAAGHEGKCLRACVMKHFGLLNDEGKLVKDVAIEIGKRMIEDEDQKDMAVDVVDACEPLEVDEDHCEAAIEYGMCITEHAHELGLVTVEL